MRVGIGVRRGAHDPCALFQPLVDARDDDAATPGTYYIGVVDRCQKTGLYSGIEGIPGPTTRDAALRIGVIEIDAPLSWALGGVMASLQGRPTLGCPPGPFGDPDYPYSDGGIGVWGFGIEDFQLRHPTSPDISAGCGAPAWISDYTWHLIHERLATISAWD